MHYTIGLLSLCDVIVDFAGFGQTTADALEAVRPQGTVVIVGMGKLESNINTYLMITKEITLLGSNGGSVEDLKGVYDCFATGKMNSFIVKIQNGKKRAIMGVLGKNLIT